MLCISDLIETCFCCETWFTAWLSLFIEKEKLQVTFEFHQSINECEDKKLLFNVSDPDNKTCHGFVTFKKEFDSDNERGDLMMKMHKKRAPCEKIIIVSERKEKRYECAHCDYVSRAQYITARHIARVHQHSIKLMKCDHCEFRTI